jgi:hypothetical protein
MKPIRLLAVLALSFAGVALAQSAPAPKPAVLEAHIKADITRHRAMAQAHEGAAKCLESGKTEEVCLKELQAACKGLAIGKYCGMRHEH